MRETTMKQRTLIVALVLGLAGVLAGCSADSPTAPKTTPTPTSYSITLESSASSAEVGAAILLSARVTQGQQSVPDNTSVTFSLYSCPGPGVASNPSFENGMCQIIRTTSGGTATATIMSSTAGLYGVTARVAGQAASKNVTFFDPVNPRALAIYGVDPNRGRPQGGEQVVINGRGFAKPITVDFEGQGTRHAAVVSVNPAGTEIVVITPNTDFLDATYVDIVVTAAAGTGAEVTDTLERGFLFEKPTNAPMIYQIIPSQGLVTGGEQVIIKGANFVPTITVKFGDEDVQVVGVSADYSTITLLTPTHSGAAGTVDVTVKNGQNLSSTRASGWTWVPVKTEPGEPVIYDINPNRGSPRGGQEVTITGVDLCQVYSAVTGKCAEPPSVVFAIPGGGDRPAAVISFADNGKQIKVLTPEASSNPVLTDLVADVRVTNSKGTATRTAAYTYVGEAGEPEILGISPNKGSARGGDTVKIFGRYFLAPVQVQFSVGGLAEVVEVSADKTEITIKTPAASVGPIGEDVYSDVTVKTQYGTGRDKEFTLVNGFLFLADEPTPELFALSPNSGPVDGGTRVTITGQGFQYPVQVYFGERQAQVVSSNFYQVICVAPSITPSQPGTPTTVDVTVLNTATGKRSNALTFRYGEAMFLSAISPNHGPADEETTVTIYGQGFVGPVEVVTDAGGEKIQASVLSVSGTEIIARIRPLPDNRRACGIIEAEVTVTNLNSNISASGVTFYYESPAPLITSVEITAASKVGNDNTVPQYNPNPSEPSSCRLAPWSDYKVTVRGSNFQKSGAVSAMVIAIPGVTAELPTTFVTANEIYFTLPDLTGVAMQEISCMVGAACGLQYVSTPVALTVKNLRSDCSDTLPGAIVIVPCNTACRAGLSGLAITGEPAADQRVGTPFSISLTFVEPAVARTTPVTVSLTYFGFSASPAQVMIPVGAASPLSVTITPTVAGTGNIMAQIGSGVCAVSDTSGLVTVLPPLLQITSACPPGGTVGTAYSSTLTASGGTTPYTWSVVAGTLPPGIGPIGGSTGILAGTPTTAGTYAGITFNVADSGTPGQNAQQTCQIIIAP